MNDLARHTLVVLLAGFACASGPVAASPGDDKSVAVPFDLGARGFLRGDGIEVTEVRGDRPKFELGGVYVVRGHYKLASTDKATLALYFTNGEIERLSKSASNTKIILRGSGTFELSFRVIRVGDPHVSFYPVPQGEGFGGLYFGHGEQLRRSAKWYERLEGLDRPPAK